MPPREWNAASYDRMSDPQLAMARDVIDRLDLRGDERVLDAGCGTGRVTEVLARARPERHGDRGRRQRGDGRRRRASGSATASRRSPPTSLELELDRAGRRDPLAPPPSTGSPTTSGCSRACTPRCGPAAGSSPSAAAPATSPTSRRRSTRSITRRCAGGPARGTSPRPSRRPQRLKPRGLHRRLDLAAAVAGRARRTRASTSTTVILGSHLERLPAEDRGRVRRRRARAARRARPRQLRAAEHPREDAEPATRASTLPRTSIQGPRMRSRKRCVIQLRACARRRDTRPARTGCRRR